MANNFADLIVDSTAAIAVVSRELTGYIPAAERNFSAARAGVGQAVNYDITPAIAAGNITPGMTRAAPADVVVGAGQITISKQREASFGYTGEERLSLMNSGGEIILSRQGKLVAQAIRTLVNEVEADLAAEAISRASRAYGAVGTVPFAGGDTGPASQVRKILVDNGAPPDRQLVVDTTSGAALGTAIGWNANRGQIAEMNDQGVILSPHGMSVRETGVTVEHTAGTAAGATTTNAGFAVGTTVIALASAGTGTILVGDVVSFAGDANKYVVTSGDADVSNGGSITIASPGLREAIPASATNITLTASHVKQAGFSRSALHLVARAPALPEGGDDAAFRTMITDPRSGLMLELSEYKGYRMTALEVALAWAVKGTQPEHIVQLIR